MKKLCKVCSKEYKIKPSRKESTSYCSRTCMAVDYSSLLKKENNPNYRNSGKKICNHCNSHYKSYNKERNFCSNKCYRDSKLEINFYKSILMEILYFHRLIERPVKKNYYKKRDKKTKNNKKYFCKVCLKSEVSRKAKYCDDCRKNKSLLTSVCPVCEKSFKRKSSEIKRVTISYCSKECRHKQAPEFNPNWRGGKKELSSLIRCSDKNKNIIKTTLARDNYTCRQCGKVGGKLEVDHIKKFSLVYDEFIEINKEHDKYVLLDLAMRYEPFWDENNLQVLCKACNWQKELNYRRQLLMKKRFELNNARYEVVKSLQEVKDLGL